MEVLINEIEKYDKSDMFSLLENFHNQCKEGYNLKIDFNPGSFDKIVFIGMGGSAISGDVMKTLIEETNEIPVFTLRDYIVPEFVDDKTFAIIESYSGNTEETISAYSYVKNKNCNILMLSSNGEMEKIAKQDNIPIIKIPAGMPPRCAFGYLFFPVYRVFAENKILPSLNDKFFEKIKSWINELLPDKENNQAINLAQKFHNKVPLIYSENKFYPGILRWKTQIAENSKQFCFVNVLPEMNHNEIMSFSYPEWFINKTICVFIVSDLEHERVKERIRITSQIISEKVSEIMEIKLKGENLLEKLIYLIILGDWISFYLAILNKVDPTEIPEINILKEELKRRKK